MTLTEFLLARIAEDEARLRKAERPWSAPHDPDCDYYPGDTPCTCNLLERLLAECEAKRRIVANAQDPGDDIFVRLLALPFADHSDYREEWKL